MTRPALVLVLVAIALPPVAAVSVLDEADGVLLVHVDAPAPRAYALVTDAPVTVAWTGPDDTADAWRVKDTHPLTLTPGTHRFEVTRARADGWLLLVPEDAGEAGAAVPFTPVGGWPWGWITVAAVTLAGAGVGVARRMGLCSRNPKHR